MLHNEDIEMPNHNRQQQIQHVEKLQTNLLDVNERILILKPKIQASMSSLQLVKDILKQQLSVFNETRPRFIAARSESRAITHNIELIEKKLSELTLNRQELKQAKAVKKVLQDADKLDFSHF